MCLHYILYWLFLFIMRGLRKAACRPLPLREGPPLSPSPFPFRVQGMYQPPYWCFFLKSTRPSLPLKKAPPLFPSPFPLRGQGMCQPPYSVLKPLRYKVGGPSEVYASFLCGMGPQGENLLKNGCVGCDHRDKMDGALRNLLILSSYSP